MIYYFLDQEKMVASLPVTELGPKMMKSPIYCAMLTWQLSPTVIVSHREDSDHQIQKQATNDYRYGRH